MSAARAGSSGRLVSVGNVIVDLVTEIPALPARGGDVVATGSSMRAGGGFNVLVAAARQGMPAAYAGAHGTGAFGELARNALRDEGIEILQPPFGLADTGYDIALVDEGGERTFVTVVGAEAALTPDLLSRIGLRPADCVYVSGYGLLRPPNQSSILDWVEGLPQDHLVFVDPGPLVGSIPREIQDRMRARADWWSCNAGEAEAMTGRKSPADAAIALHRAVPEHGVIVRTGSSGCVVIGRDGVLIEVGGFEVETVDMNGAGDAHAGAFLAALARGEGPAAAARNANACAALAVTRRGPATAPSLAELTAFLRFRET